MRKYLGSITLVLLLIGLPLGSYLYLRKGFEFRKELIDELKTGESLKIPIASDSTAIPMKGACTIVSVNGNAEDLLNLYDQFKDARGFQLAAQLDEQKIKQLDERRKRELDKPLPKNYFPLDDQVTQALKSAYTDKAYLILDSTGMVRKTYAASKEDLKKIAGHITVLLPLYKEK